MKLTILFLLITFNLFSQIDTFSGNNYLIVFDESKKQPIYIKYGIACKKTDICYNRSKYSFNKKGIEKIKTTINSDYVKNDYDKGHMIPAEQVCCDSNMLKFSFLFINCALQHKGLNRGIWKSIEMIEKRLATNPNNFVMIEIKPLFTKNSIKSKNNATIPDGFYRNIYLNGKLLKKYYFPNIEPEYTNLINYEL